MPAFVLPDLGEGLTEAEIVSWHVQVGDVVAVDQEVVEVETAKAVVEIPVPFAGRVTQLHAGPGDMLAVGAPLITVSDEAASGRADGASAARADGASGNVLIGYGTAGTQQRRRRPARKEPAAASTRPP